MIFAKENLNTSESRVECAAQRMRGLEEVPTVLRSKIANSNAFSTVLKHDC